ncbi:MAG: TRAP transporter small permease subunit [Pseudomonadota bacterium]
MDDGPQENRRSGVLRRLLLALGSAALLLAMASDALAVLGRHAGFAVNGSIELFQVCAVIALSSAIVLATIDARHAAVDLLLGRVSDRGKVRLRLAGALASAAAFGLITAGSIWVAGDLWATREMTEQLGIPLLGFRLFWIACGLVVTAFYLRALWRGLRA